MLLPWMWDQGSPFFLIPREETHAIIRTTLKPMAILNLNCGQTCLPMRAYLLKRSFPCSTRRLILIIYSQIPLSTGLVSLMTLCVLSLQRLLCIAWPKRYKGISYNRVAQIITLVWIAVLSISIPPLVGWGKYVPETSGIR